MKDVQYLKTQMEVMKISKSTSDKALSELVKDVQDLKGDNRLTTLIKDFKGHSESIKTQCNCCNSPTTYYSSTTAALTQPASSSSVPSSVTSPATSKPPVVSSPSTTSKPAVAGSQPSTSDQTATSSKPYVTSNPVPSTTQQLPFSDCAEVYASGRTADAVYEIQVDASRDPVRVWCQKGWLVMQRRTDGRQSFNRTFSEYETGFGDPTSDHWQGLQTVSSLTNSKPYQLRVEFLLDDSVGDAQLKYIEFSSFSLTKDYRLQLKNGSTNYPLGLQELEKQSLASFSAVDKDQDKNSTTNCARESGGGWWMATDCRGPNLNSARTAGCAAANPVCGVLRAFVKATTMLVRPVGA